jgi:trans-2,3-dihydro-3-hydroxyanthranilate isomerase
MTAYRIYDVFTDSAFGGNPLAVITDATALAGDRPQRIARESNVSKTSFVYPPADPAQIAGASGGLDIRQVKDMGRPSRMSARTDGTGVTIGGAAPLMMEVCLVL